MRRILAVIGVSLGLGALMAPLSLTLESGQLSVVVQTAQAVQCIELSVPINIADSGGCPPGSIPDDPATGGAIVFYLKQILRLLSGAVGLVIVLILVIAGIQYITATGDPALIKRAKERIINAMTALVLFVLAYAIINFLVPGGIL
jgi:hypothetical protein